MNMVFAPDGQNVYGYEMLSEWMQKKFTESISVDQLQQMSPNALQNKLTSISTEFHNTGLDQEIESKLESTDRYHIIEWLNYRFDTRITDDQLPDSDDPQFAAAVKDIATEFLRKELADLEKYVLLQVYDGAWKSHLYVMDHLKDSIWMRSFAERDPKVEYKREGFRMFEQMLDSIEDRVTDIVFRVHLQAGQQARSVWNVSQAAHDQVGQFSMAERQRAAAQAPQGEIKVKQIKLERPKVGRNEPCPCGSGKKYKKCCGRE
jgi:preprotein translocase subunit SecA